MSWWRPRQISFFLAGLLVVITSCVAADPSGATTRRPLVSRATALAVVNHVFPLWQRDLHSGDAKGLGAIETGIQLDWDKDNCATTAYVLHTPCPDSPMLGKAVIVPKQYRYPVRVLGEVQTIGDTEAMSANAPIERTPALDLIVLTKATARASWIISFETALYSTTSSPPPFLPSAPSRNGLAAAVSQKEVRAMTSLPGDLAAYWQSWKVHGAAPSGTAFLPGPFTTSFGAELATTPDGVVGANLEQNVLYSSNPSVDGVFVFPVGFGRFTPDPPDGSGYSGTSGTLVCSAIRVSIDFTPEPGGPPLVQRADEVDFGPGLAPGTYSSVLDESVHSSCVLTDGQHLSALGSDGDVFSQVGTSQSSPV